MSDRKQFFQDIKLMIDDWEFFGKTHTFLQPFAGFMFVGEGEKSSISQVLNTMDVFLKHYKQRKEIYFNLKIQNNKMLHSINMGWFLFNKYYHKINEVLIYASVFFLDIMKCTAYFWQNWLNNWIELAIASASKFFEDSYKHTPLIDVEDFFSEPPSKRFRNKFDGFKDSFRK